MEGWRRVAALESPGVGSDSELRTWLVDAGWKIDQEFGPVTKVTHAKKTLRGDQLEEANRLLKIMPREQALPVIAKIFPECATERAYVCSLKGTSRNQTTKVGQDMNVQHYEQFQVGDIPAEPFRDLERPLRDEKVKALRESIRRTDDWENLEARIGRDGKPEIPYGHHRLEALRQEYGEGHSIRLMIRNLDDADMVAKMIEANRDDWNSTTLDEHEIVRGVVRAYGQGSLHLSQPDPKTKKAAIRYAPSLLRGDDPTARSDHAYTATTLAGYLRWNERKVQHILLALEQVKTIRKEGEAEETARRAK